MTDTPEPGMDSISIDTAVAIAGVSRSTLWRRVADGSMAKGDKDERGRATLALAGVLDMVHDACGVTLSGEDIAILLQADAGDAAAQTDMGALFWLAGARNTARYWLQQAAAQNETEAMYWLGIISATEAEQQPATAQARRNSEAVMWLARAAALGHPTASAQMAGLLARAGIARPQP